MKQISCTEARELISPYLDGYTTPGETEALEHHFNYCIPCSAEFAGYRKISSSLLQLHEVSCPDTLTAAIMSRLKEDLPKRKHSLRDRFAERFGAARKTLAVAAAAALIMAGSAGLTTGYKLVAGNIDNTPEPPPKQHYEVAVNNGEIEITQPDDVITVLEPDVDKNSPANDQTGAGSQPVNDRPEPVAVTTHQEGGTTTAVTDREPVVLLSYDIIIESSILKVAVNSVEEANRQAVKLAAGAGGKAQMLSQSNNGLLIQIMQLTVPMEKAPDTMTALAGLGRELERRHEKQNITAQYRDLATRYNELVALNETTNGADSNLASQLAAAKEQLNNWTRDAGNYTIVLWLEQ